MIRILLASALLFTSDIVFALEPDQLFERLSPSIWAVSVYDAAGSRTGGGSAVVIGPEELVTNCHVLARVQTITVKRENMQHDARLLNPDIERDLCILRAKDMVAPPVQIAPLASIRVGQRVYAIGVPRGAEQSLSDGLVSSLPRGRNDAIQNIQISIPISPGLSGGGLFDQQGRLLGITTWNSLDAQNQYFARPAEWINDVPARSKIALEKLRDDQRTAAPSAKIPAVASAPEERQLPSEEMRKHFENFVLVSNKGSFIAGMQLDFRTNGNLTVRDPATRQEFYGTFRFKDSGNQICLMVNPRRGSSESPYKVLQDCYRQFEVSKNNFALRSISDSTVLLYTKN